MKMISSGLKTFTGDKVTENSALGRLGQLRAPRAHTLAF
jgi:hypothetical protein